LKPEQNLAKMERSSVLDSLKRPLPHQLASRDSKPKKQEQER